MPHRCEQETSRNCHAFNWIMGQILSQHNYSNDAPTRQTHSGLGSEPAWPATNCNRISQGAQQLFPTHTQRGRKRKRGKGRENGKWKAVQGNRKTSLALHSPSPSSPSPSSLPFPAGVRVAPAHGI